MQLQYGTSLRKYELRRKGRIEQRLTPIAAELIGSHCCEPLGFVGKDNSPVLSLCRSLLAAGLNPDQALDVYRAGTLALRVKSLRAATSLRVKEPEHGRVQFCKFPSRPLWFCRHLRWRLPMQKNGRGPP